MPIYEHGGQPTKFTPLVKQRLLEAVSRGAPYALACKYARIHYNTLRNWILLAEKEQIPEYVEFLDDLSEAEGKALVKWLTNLDSAMDEGAWQAAAWKLERRHYKYFSNNAQAMEFDERLSKMEEHTKLKDDPNGSEEVKTS